MTDAQTRMLIIESDQSAVEQLTRALEASEAFDLDIYNASDLARALELLDLESFDVIILELILPDSIGLQTLETVYGRAPDIPIVVLTSVADDAVALSAAQHGAQEYLVKNETPDTALVRAIRYAMQRHQLLAQQVQPARSHQRGRIIAFIGAKGGTGTTTVGSNVAAALARQGHDAIIAELRADFGTLALQLNRIPRGSLGELLALPLEQIDQHRIEMQLMSMDHGPRLLCSPQRPEQFRDLEPEQADAVVTTLCSMCDFTILDLPANQSLASQAAVRLADYVGLTVQPEHYCLEAAAVRLKQLKAWDVSPAFIGLVVVSRMASGYNVPMEEIRDRLDSRIIGVMPPAAEACAAAIAVGQPLVYHQPEQIAALTLTEMADRLSAASIEPMPL
jgi:Flp pilus assembly CpaE family ATPase